RYKRSSCRSCWPRAISNKSRRSQIAVFASELGAEDDGWVADHGRLMRLWSRQQESNLHLSLRRTLFYPLNYGELHKTNGRLETRMNTGFPVDPPCFPADQLGAKFITLCIRYHSF